MILTAWTSRKNSLEMIELSSINKISYYTGLIRDDPYWTSRKNRLEPLRTDRAIQYK
jgi:hypothetical protein